MQKVIGVVFNTARIYYFDPGDNKYERGSYVIVETERGEQFGKVDTDEILLKKEQIKGELKRVLRKANDKDERKHNKNLEDAKEALETCREIAESYELDMNIIDAVYTFDRSQLLFHFIASDRIDFRELVRELANIYRTRIELRQVGIRDKAACVGGIGICGRQICCNSFLDDLDIITIGMAKNQNLALNPSKINGLCGRLLCCLKYEDETYKEFKKGLPKVGDVVKTKNGEGTVVNVDVLNRTYKVDLGNNNLVEEKVNDSVE